MVGHFNTDGFSSIHSFYYSKQENGGVCLPCVLFASDGYHGSDPVNLVQQPLTSFVKALETFRKHSNSTSQSCNPLSR